MPVTPEQVQDAIKQVVECFEDGFHFSDVLTAVKVAAEIAETFVDMTGEEKKTFAVDVISQAYRRVDPNIPWIPEPVETWIENYVLKNLVPAAIQLLVKATKGEIKVNQDAANL